MAFFAKTFKSFSAIFPIIPLSVAGASTESGSTKTAVWLSRLPEDCNAGSSSGKTSCMVEASHIQDVPSARMSSSNLSFCSNSISCWLETSLLLACKL